MHWIRSADRSRSLVIGSLMGLVVLIGLALVPTFGFSYAEVGLAVLVLGGPGVLAGREVNFLAFRESFLGVPRGKRDSWWWAAVVIFSLNAALGILGQVVTGEFAFAAMGFVLWWAGVFVATGLAVVAEMRLEKVLLRAEWREDDPRWFHVRRMAEEGLRWEGALLRGLRRIEREWERTGDDDPSPHRR